MGPRSFVLSGGQGEDPSSRNPPSDDAARPRDSRAEEGPMKSVLLTAALVAAATAPSFAKTVRIPVTRGAGGVPIPCAEDPLGTCHNRWHPDIPEVAQASAGDTVIFETRDAFDNPFNRSSTRATVAGPAGERGRVRRGGGAPGETGVRASSGTDRRGPGPPLRPDGAREGSLPAHHPSARKRGEHRREADGEGNDAALPLLHRRLRALHR